MTPIDKELIEFGLLNKKERNWLNSYHKKIFFKLSKFMNKMEYLELKKDVQLFKILFQSFSVTILIFKDLAGQFFFS